MVRFCFGAEGDLVLRAEGLGFRGFGCGTLGSS